MLQWSGLPTDAYDTLVLISGGRAYVRSEAILRILGQLPMPWRLAAVGRVLPLAVRDWCYDRVARNRYRLFGRYQSCPILTPDHRSRFLDD